MGKIPSNAPHAGRAGNATNHMDEVPIPGRGGAAQAGQGGAPGALNGIQPVNRTAPPQPVRNAPARERSDFDEVHGVIPTPRQIRLMAQYAPADMSQNPPPQAHRFVKNDETGTIQPAAQAAQMQPAAQAAQMQPAAQAAQMQPAARAAQLQPAAQAAQMRPEDMRPEQPPLEIVNAVFRDDIANMEAQDLAPLLDDQPLMYQLERFLDDTDWFGTVVFNDNIGVGVNTESRYIALPERLMDPDIADLHAALRAVVNLPPLQAQDAGGHTAATQDVPQTAGVEDPAGADLLEGFDTEAVQDAGEDRISVTAQDGQGSVDLNNIEDHETEAPQDPAVEETQDAAGAGAAGAPARATEPRPLGTQPTQAEIDAMPEGPEKYATIRGVWTQRDNDNPKT